MARRYLKLSPAEWDELPWWEQVLYLDGMAQEGLLDGSGRLPRYTRTVGPQQQAPTNDSFSQRNVQVPSVNWDGLRR